uniref:Uncharacterized protein n=1 Tax=Panagrolaimus davidi TaxID=227884 RepID=A0A914P9Y6_9BILA
MDDATKNELSEILPLIKFSCMDYEFVKIKKKFLFSLSESIQVLSLSNRMWKAHVIAFDGEDFIELVSNTEEEDFIELIYELVEQYALETQKADPEADLKEAIKKKFDEVFPRINFPKIHFKFFTKFFADKEFLFSHTQLCKALSKSIKNKLEEEKVYEMAEKEAIKKQQLTIDNNDLNDIIKAEMSEFLNDFLYYKMSFAFFIEFIVPKAFIFSELKLYHGLSNIAGNEDQEILFNTVFKLAEAEATKALSVNPYISVNKYIKRIFLEITRKIKFSQIKLEFMIENIGMFFFFCKILIEVLYLS